jgi:AcrR family transcriptional regulator
MNKSQTTHPSAPTEALSASKPPNPAALGRRERRAAETRLRLFRSALRLFAERGFPKVTIEDITEAADVGKGTFFNYFESKDHVLSVVAEIQIGKVREASAKAGEGRLPIRTVLHGLLAGLTEEPGRSPDLARALIASFLASEGVRTIIENNMQRGRRVIGAIIAAGQRRGEIDPALDEELVAIQFLQAFEGTMLFWSLHGEPALTLWVEQSFQHFWRAIAAPAREQTQ